MISLVSRRSSMRLLILGIGFFNLVASQDDKNADNFTAFFAIIGVLVVFGILIFGIYKCFTGNGFHRHRGKQRVRIGRTFVGQTLSTGPCPFGSV